MAVAASCLTKEGRADPQYIVRPKGGGRPAFLREVTGEGETAGIQRRVATMLR